MDYYPAEGRYDLRVANTNYDRDNGKFECRIKEDGTGVELFTGIIKLRSLYRNEKGIPRTMITFVVFSCYIMFYPSLSVQRLWG